MPWTIEADGSYKYLASGKEAEAVAPCLLFATLIGAARKSAVPVTAFKDALKTEPALKLKPEWKPGDGFAPNAWVQVGFMSYRDQIDRDPLE